MQKHEFGKGYWHLHASTKRLLTISLLTGVITLTACASVRTSTATVAVTIAATLSEIAPTPINTVATPASAAAATPPAETTIVPTEAALLEGQALVDLLRRGGHVIFFRHAATDSSQTDSDTQNLENCPAQRNLTEQGRSDARAIGQAFQTFGIPVGQVLASPYCRTLETARLAFERVEPSGDLLPTIAAVNAAEREALVAGLRRLLSTPPTPPNNTILVSHQFSLQDATGVSIAEGEAAVFEPLGANGFRLVARVLLNSWPTLMQTMSPQPEHFATGWMASEGDRGSVWGRPVDVLVLPDGSMLISDDDGGAIYRITYSTPASTP